MEVSGKTRAVSRIGAMVEEEAAAAAEAEEEESELAVEIAMVLADEEIMDEKEGEVSEIQALPSMVVLEEEEEPQSRRMDMAGEKAMVELKKQKQKQKQKQKMKEKKV